MAPWSLGIEDAPGTLNNYAQDRAWQLDYILQLAEQGGIYIQLTLTWHGMFETAAGLLGVATIGRKIHTTPLTEDHAPIRTHSLRAVRQ